jgi:hypothetical protein
MPRVKLTESVIDDLPTPAKDAVYWDAGCPGFGIKVTPAGRKVPASHLDRGLSSREIAPSTARQVIKVAKKSGITCVEAAMLFKFTCWLCRDDLIARVR